MKWQNTVYKIYHQLILYIQIIMGVIWIYNICYWCEVPVSGSSQFQIFPFNNFKYRVFKYGEIRRSFSLANGHDIYIDNYFSNENPICIPYKFVLTCSYSMNNYSIVCILFSSWKNFWTDKNFCYTNELRNICANMNYVHFVISC